MDTRLCSPPADLRGLLEAVWQGPQGAGSAGRTGTETVLWSRVDPWTAPPTHTPRVTSLASVWPGLCRVTLSCTGHGKEVFTAGRHQGPITKGTQKIGKWQPLQPPSKVTDAKCPGDVALAEGRCVGDGSPVFQPRPRCPGTCTRGSRRAAAVPPSVCAPSTDLCLQDSVSPGREEGVWSALCRYRPLSWSVVLALELPVPGGSPQPCSTSRLFWVPWPLGLRGLTCKVGSWLLPARMSGASETAAPRSFDTPGR